MKNIAILGGSFDPIHIGHIIAGQCVLDTELIDEIWVMPTGNPPHKVLSQTLNRQRFELCKRAVENIDGFSVSDFELNRSGKVYSVDTFDLLKKDYVDIKFWLIIGSDSVLNLEDWYDAKRLLTIGNFIVVDRGGFDVNMTKTQINKLKSTYEADFMYVKMPLIELSSTHIRQRVKECLSIRYRVPESVEKYINEEGLYKD